jgi:UPF0755 protein
MSLVTKLSGIFILLLSFVVGWAWMDYQHSLTMPVISEQPVSFEIEKGDTFSQITKKLIENDVKIKSFWFKLLAYQKDMTHKLKTGEYQLKPGLTSSELLTMLVSGKSRQYTITFPEGFTFKQIRKQIKQSSKIKHTLDKLDDTAILAKLGSKENHPEGLFFPDTYHFDKNATDISLLQRAYRKMQQILSNEWQNKTSDLPLKTPYDALILASIVEKETGKASERQQIAGVFTRRLRKGMLLQTDPTVIYGMGENYKGNIRYKDLRTPTPYNTYVIKGLPPTPIAMPGKEAIHAALHPAAGNSLYFVSRGNGSHVFSATLKDHNNAVNTYQRKSK